MGTFLCLVTSNQLSAQEYKVNKPLESGENIRLFSDRLLYGVSEKLFYTAFYQKPPQISSLEWSTVLYVELITWNGTKLAQSKIPIENGYANGYIQVPENIKSGNYYLRTYTKWMRNYSPYTYTYLPVKIVNPYSIFIDKGPETNEISAKTKVESSSELADGIVISELQETYRKRQFIEFEISLSDNNLSGQYCISVAKLGSLDVANNSFRYINTNDTESSKEIEFLPEISGLSVSGKIADKNTAEPVQNMKINLSSYSSSFYLSSATSDKEGSFVFTLPHYEGNYEFHLAKESNSNEESEILVANEFCHQPITLPYTAFQLNGQERLTAEEIVLNSQLGGKYIEVDSSLQSKQDISTAFYGIPTTIIYEKDFIELIDLKEFFYELVYSVSVGYLKRKPYLIINGQTSLVSYPPLILMDNIPVANDEKLLETPCRKIERIEVINKGYVVGDNMYSGIISIFSENKDMAGLESTKNSHFFSYQLYSNNDYSVPDYSITTNRSTAADRRNLLYWQPQLQLSREDTTKVSFYTSDAPGHYVVCLRGLDSENNSTVYGKAIFTVK